MAAVSSTRRGGGAADWRGPRAARASQETTELQIEGQRRASSLRDVSTGERPAALRTPTPRPIGVKVLAPIGADACKDGPRLQNNFISLLTELNKLKDHIKKY